MASSTIDLVIPTPKRHKIDVACTPCRTRKSKCDGVRPVCGPCLKRRNGRQLCAYRETKRDSPDPSGADVLPTPRTVEQPPSRIFGGSYSFQRPASRASSRASDSTDAMGAVDAWALKAGLLGTSSSTNFMRQMRKAVDGRDSPDRGARGATSSHVTHEATRLFQRQHEWRMNLHGPEYVLPPRSTADRLMGIYWQHAWVIFPFVDDEQVSRCYDGLWSGNVTQYFDQKVFHCILNLMFALACKLDPTASPGEQESSSNTYFARARGLLVFDLLDISDFQLVQALLLMSQFLQSTNMPRQCFQTVGMAIWIAQDLGLHLSETALAIQDHRQRAFVQRVWQSCLLMDRITAMTFGRPTRLAHESSPSTFPPLTDPRAAHPSRLKFFEEYCQLHLILGGILSSFYTHSPNKDHSPGTSTQALDQLIRFDRRLTDWDAKVVPYLKIHALSSRVNREANADGPVFERQANTLYARYLHTRMLLWRPFFLRPLSQKVDDSSFSAEMAQFTNTHSQINSVAAAQQLVTLVHENFNKESTRGISYWYSIYYLYNAATVLIAAGIFPALLQVIPLTAVSESIEQAYHCLRKYEIYTVSARRCRMALEVLQNKITANGSVAWSEGGPTPGLPSQPFSAEANPEGMNEVADPLESWVLFEGMDMFWLDNALLNQGDLDLGS